MFAGRHKLTLFLCIFIVLVITPEFSSAQTTSNYYKVTLFSDGSKITMQDLNVKYNRSELFSTYGNFYYNLFSDKKGILFSSNFSIPLTQRNYKIENSQIIDDWITLNETTFDLEIPYFDNAEYINLYSPSRKILLSTSVKGLQRNLCGDLTCQNDETDKSCPEDCMYEEMLVRESARSNMTRYAILSGAALVIVALWILSLKKKKR